MAQKKAQKNVWRAGKKCRGSQSKKSEGKKRTPAPSIGGLNGVKKKDPGRMHQLLRRGGSRGGNQKTNGVYGGG